MNILLLQYGDIVEAWDRLAAGGPETYRDQKRSVEAVAKLAEYHRVTVLCINEEECDVDLVPGLRGIRISYSSLTRKRIRSLLRDVQPDCLICRSPHLAMLQEALRAHIPTLPAFADIFAPDGLRRRLWAWRVAHVLRDSRTFPVSPTIV